MIWRYHNEEKYDKHIYYSFVGFLIFSVLFILAIIFLYGFSPYDKINAGIQLVRAMSNIYGADYASPELHNAMGGLLGKTQSDREAIGNYLNANNGGLSSAIIRNLNPDMYKDIGDPRQLPTYDYNELRQFSIDKREKEELEEDRRRRRMFYGEDYKWKYNPLSAVEQEQEQKNEKERKNWEMKELKNYLNKILPESWKYLETKTGPAATPDVDGDGNAYESFKTHPEETYKDDEGVETKIFDDERESDVWKIMGACVKFSIL